MKNLKVILFLIICAIASKGIAQQPSPKKKVIVSFSDIQIPSKRSVILATDHLGNLTNGTGAVYFEAQKVTQNILKNNPEIILFSPDRTKKKKLTIDNLGNLILIDIE